MFSFPLLLADKAPSIGFTDFQPGFNKEFINGNATATSEIFDHWFFSTAIPEWIQYILVFIAAVSVLMVVVGGVMIMMTGEDEEMKTKGGKTVVWAIAGIIISVLSYTIVEIVNQVPITNQNPDTEHLAIEDPGGVIDPLAGGKLREEIIPDVIKIILQLVGVFALGLLLYAGGLLVLRDSDEEKVSKARQLIIWAVVGIIVIVVAYVVIEAVVQFNFERN